MTLKNVFSNYAIHFMFCSRVRFSGTADLMALFFDSNKFKMVKMAAAAILDISNGHISATATYIARIARSSLR